MGRKGKKQGRGEEQYEGSEGKGVGGQRGKGSGEG